MGNTIHEAIKLLKWKHNTYIQYLLYFMLLPLSNDLIRNIYLRRTINYNYFGLECSRVLVTTNFL